MPHTLAVVLAVALVVGLALLGRLVLLGSIAFAHMRRSGDLGGARLGGARVPRGRGFHHRPEKYFRLGAPHPTVGAAPSPPAGDLRGLKKRKLNQGRSESCGGHGSACLNQVALASCGTPLDFDPSPRLGYADTRCIEQPGTAPLTDSGVDPVDLLMAFATEGVGPMPTNADGSLKLTPDGRVSDVWSADDLAGIPNAPSPNIGTRPTAVDDAQSQRCLLDTTACNLLDPTAPDFEDHVSASIGVDKVPVGVGIHATPIVEAWGDSYVPGKVPLTDASGTTDEDGHWIAVYAYATVSGGVATCADGSTIPCPGFADGSKIYWLGNSWGDWGDPQGGIWMSGACLRALVMVAIRWAVKRKAAAS